MIMKTTTLDVGGMLSTLDYQAVEKQLARMPGVEHASAGIASNSATIEYDETVTGGVALEAAIRDCGFHCAGEIMPKHVCEPHRAAAAGRQAPMPPGPMGVAATRPAGPAPHTHEQAGAPPGPAMPMAHGMGHGGGMDMQAMGRDMRNRFWSRLVFSVPILLYSPIGRIFITLRPPFGIDLDLLLFVLASAAIIYPSWPFV